MKRHLINPWAALRHSWVRLLYAAFAIAWAWPFWSHAGQCIIGLHDWGWMCYPQQAGNQFMAAFAPWNENNLGHTAILPSTSPVALAAPALALFIPHFALALVLTTAIFCALIGCGSLLRYLGCTSHAAEIAASSLYVTSPFFVTKLISGHIGFILALAALPFAFRELLAVSKDETRGLCLAVLFSAITATQLQVGILLMICSIVVFRVPMKHLAVIWGVAGLTYLPAAFITVAALLTGAVQHPVQLPTWVAEQSIPLNHILDAEYYFANYYADVAAEPTRIVFTVAGFISALFLLLRGGVMTRLVLTVICLGLIAGGTRGLLAFLVAPLLFNFPPANVFRELYDLLAIVPLTVSLGMGLLFSGLTVRGYITTGAVAALIAAAGAPWFGSGMSHTLGFRDPALWQRQVDFVTSQRRNGRALWLPATSPITAESDRSGADPFETGFGDVPSANSYDPSGLFAYIAAVADTKGHISSALARRADISVVVSRPGLLSARVKAPSVTRIGAQTYYSEGSPAALAQGEAACEPDLRSQMAQAHLYVRCSTGYSGTILGDARANTDPSIGWVQRDVSPFIDAQLQDPRWPVFLTRSTAPLQVRSYIPEHLWLRGKGRLCLDRVCAYDLHTEWQAYDVSSGVHVLRLRGPGMVMEFQSARHPAFTTVNGARESGLKVLFESRYFGFYRLQVPAHKAGWLVLREGWAPIWRIWGEGTNFTQSPDIVDDYANGWHIGANTRESSLVVFDVLAIPYVALLIVCWAVWALLITRVVRSSFARRARLQPAG